MPRLQGLGFSTFSTLGFGLIRKCFATGHFMWMPFIDARFSRPLREAKCICGDFGEVSDLDVVQ